MAKILENTTISAIELDSVGISIPASSTYTINPLEYPRFAETDFITEVTTLINAGDIIVNDGVDDIPTTARMIDFLEYPDTAFNVRFLSETERSNNFSSKSVQEAIEESRVSAIGTLLPYAFISNGNTANKWMSYSSGGFATSDIVPLIVPQDSTLKGLTYANQDDNTDCNIELHINGTLAYTEEIRNKRAAWIVGSLSVNVSQGDRVSVYLKKFTGGTGDSTPQNPLVTLLGKFTDEAAADSGIQNGL